MSSPRSRRAASFGSSAVAFLVAIISGSASCWLMARVAPADGLLLASLALIPLWIALEFFFEVVVESLGALGRSARTTACGHILTSH